ncbi:MAG: glycosyltransferase [Bdellovibrionaceae bacterium]|nr:glycosyltransferase [Pseudobdellovibrionaceae bacterium]
MKKIAIFIPCYNSARRIRHFLQSFDKEILNDVYSVICVDNASDDSTLKVLEATKAKSPLLQYKLLIFKNKKNYGLGGSHKIVFTYLIENNYSHCLILPSNYKGSPKEIAKQFFTHLVQHPDSDILIGKRIFKSQLDFQTKIVKSLSNKIAEPLKHLLSDFKFSDIGSRFLLLKVDILNQIPFKTLSDGREFNLQLNVLLSENKDLKIEEITLKNWAFSNTETSKIIRYSGKMIKTMSRYGINKYFFKRSGWRLFADFPDNLEREYEII